MCDFKNLLIKLSEHSDRFSGQMDILDIGCGEGQALFEIYNSTNFSFGSLIGVNSEIQEPNFRIKGKDCLRRKYLDSAEYTKKLFGNDFVYEKMNENEYLTKTDKKFDLIVISNFLHFYPKESIFNFTQLAKNKIKQSGVIYIKIANELHHYSHDNSKTVFNEELTNEFEQKFPVIWKIENRNNWELLIE